MSTVHAWPTASCIHDLDVLAPLLPFPFASACVQPEKSIFLVHTADCLHGASARVLLMQ